MIPLTLIREEFGLAKRLTPATFYSRLELGKGVIHYFFRSVRGTLPDLVTTCSDANDPEFAILLLEEVASRIDSGSAAPVKMALSESNCFGFDMVLALPSAYHGHLKGVANDKHITLVLCVPIHSFEFTGTETAYEYRQWQTRVGVESWKRQPCPYVAMEFENPRNGQGSPLERTTIEACLANLSSLKGVTKGFARLANFKGDIMLVKPVRGERCQVTLNSTRFDCSFDELSTSVSGFVKAILAVP